MLHKPVHGVCCLDFLFFPETNCPMNRAFKLKYISKFIYLTIHSSDNIYERDKLIFIGPHVRELTNS